MAKLNKDNAEKAANAETSGFEPIPEGPYHVKLVDVDADREGPKGPYWSWEFEVVEPGEHSGRKLWNNTSLADAAMFKMKETFDAFGVPTDTDTDDIVGDVCKATVSQRTIQSGARKGELANQIDRLSPKDADFEAVASGTSAASQKADDIF